jgi:hypothetical protein
MVGVGAVAQPLGAQCDRGVELGQAPPMNIPEIDEAALVLADMAFIETAGPNADRVRAAIWAYEWAKINVRDYRGLAAYPSYNELREALHAVQESGSAPLHVRPASGDRPALVPPHPEGH